MRRETRKKVFQVLYLSDVMNITPREGGGLYTVHFKNVEDKEYFEGTLNGISECMEDIDRLIASAVKNWRFDRISLVDKNILRLGAFELFFSHFGIPYPVAINEAVEIAKLYGTEESGSFVNGVLDAMGKEKIDGKGKTN